MIRKIMLVAMLAIGFQLVNVEASAQQRRQVMLDKVVAVVGGSSVLHSELVEYSEALVQQRRQMGYTFDPEGFWDYYTAVGWKIGRNTMTDWKAALRHWNTKEQEYAKRTKRYEPEIPTWTVGVRL